MEEINKNDRKYWKWGLFYYNPADSELWVDKRKGYGQTLNFAHKQSYFLLAFLILLPTLVVVIPVYFLS